MSAPQPARLSPLALTSARDAAESAPLPSAEVLEHLRRVLPVTVAREHGEAAA